MPALQVVDGMLATLGSRHSTATNQVFRIFHRGHSKTNVMPPQALELLSSHGSTIVILLKNEADDVSLPTLEEIHLIVTLCTSVLPSVPKTELVGVWIRVAGFSKDFHSVICQLWIRSHTSCHLGTVD